MQHRRGSNARLTYRSTTSQPLPPHGLTGDGAASSDNASMEETVLYLQMRTTAIVNPDSASHAAARPTVPVSRDSHSYKANQRPGRLDPFRLARAVPPVLPHHAMIRGPAASYSLLRLVPSPIHPRT